MTSQTGSDWDESGDDVTGYHGSGDVCRTKIFTKKFFFRRVVTFIEVRDHVMGVTSRWLVIGGG